MSSSAKRAAKRRANMTEEQEKEEKKKHALRQQRLRARKAAEEGRTFVPRPSKYVESDKDSSSDEDSNKDSIKDSKRGRGSQPSGDMEVWQADWLPDLAYDSDTLLPANFVEALKAVGISLQEWTRAHMLGDIMDAERDVLIERALSSVYARLSSGTYTDYDAVGSDVLRLQTSAVAGAAVQRLLSCAVDVCPVDHLRVLCDFRGQFDERVTMTRCLAANINYARVLFVTSSKAEHVVSVLNGAVASLCKQNIVMRLPSPCTFAIEERDIRRLEHAVWLNDGIINFVLAIWQNEPALQNHALLPLTVYLQGFDIAGAKFLTNTEKAVRATKSLVKGRTRIWDRMFLPISADEHFFLITIEPEFGMIKVYNSLTKAEKWPKTKVTKVIKGVTDFVSCLCKEHSWTNPCADDWVLTIPQQPNHNDCGVYMLMYIRHLCFGDSIDGPKVPLRYRFPRGSDKRSAQGARLMLLEDLKDNAITTYI
ncbi:hypothetical protein BD626DRAFT_566292 [Schizophyllum amplum]|uniref:Ubiquitin-like protease family profile domain-containing protein n=1 Tax=Schizophyllum amplum TaxID=97359 RepID=A0A550CR99_9AGAR|nr:hypothetical protein BD626DRAFT_566292 [Auriculariopsis ampla]